MGSTKSTKLRERRNRPPKEPWIWLTRGLIESDAWATAPINTRRFVERLMLEHMAHAGTENGRLICTYDDCVAYGIGRRFINASIRDAVGRGLICRTVKGKPSAGNDKYPSRYALGWLPMYDGSAASNRWKRYSAPAHRTIRSSVQRCTRDQGKGAAKNGGNACGESALVHKGALGTVYKGELGKMNFRKGNLPPGWATGRADDGHVRILRPDGVGIPVADDPLVGNG